MKNMNASRNQQYLLITRKRAVYSKKEESIRMIKKIISGVFKKYLSSLDSVIRVDILLSTLEENKGTLKNAVYIDSDIINAEDTEFLQVIIERNLNQLFTSQDLMSLRETTDITDKWGDVTMFILRRNYTF